MDPPDTPPGGSGGRRRLNAQIRETNAIFDVSYGTSAELAAMLDDLADRGQVPRYPEPGTYAYHVAHTGGAAANDLREIMINVYVNFRMRRYDPNAGSPRKAETQIQILRNRDRGSYDLSRPRPRRSTMVFGNACSYTDPDSDDDVAWYQAPNPFLGGPGPTINLELPNLPDVIPGNPNEGSDNPNEFVVP